MDMKRILQAMDGAASKPVEGANDMKKFLQAVSDKPVEIINEGSNPHKVSLPVQMAMQHYQEPKSTKVKVEKKLSEKATSSLRSYFTLVESEQVNKTLTKDPAIVERAREIAERIRLKEYTTDQLTRASVGIGGGIQSAEPTESHEQAPAHSPEDLGGADAYYGRPADHRQHGLKDDEHIRAYYHGYRAGEHMHDKSNYDESLRNENPCWKGYHPVGTKKKGGRTVPNCVPKE